MKLNELRDEAFAYAEKQGFHENNDFGRSLMLVVSELSEALEADRSGKRVGNPCVYGSCDNVWLLARNPETINSEQYKKHIRGTVEEELADAIIRICDIAGVLGIDLDWHVRAKMAFNKTRPYKHGKNY